MRVFLDENVDVNLGLHLSPHTVGSVRSMSWQGVSNGELIQRLERDYDVLLSHDKGLEHQHNWSAKDLALVVLVANDQLFESYQTRVHLILEAIEVAKPGSVGRVLL